MVKSRDNNIPLTLDQKSEVERLLAKRIRIRHRGNRSEFTIREYLDILVQKLRPILRKNESIQLVGGAAMHVGRLRWSKQEIALSDIDINIYVTQRANFSQILKHQLDTLKQLCPGATQSCLSDMLRVTDQHNNWSLVGIGCLDIKVIQKISRLFVFSVDSLFIPLDSEKLYFGSTWGHPQTALTHLRKRQLVTRKPQQIRHGLFRYVVALQNGYKAKNPESIEIPLVARFWDEFSTQDEMQSAFKKMIDQHGKKDPEYDQKIRRLVRQLIYKHTQFVLVKQ